ncbi:MAG: TetR/AcrR family transcriptional regulator [Myxococcota bacterium]
MGRTPGTRNPDYEAKRDNLTRALLPQLVGSDGPRTFAALARSAGVSVPTLKHYFGDRSGLIRACFRHAARQGSAHLEEAAKPGALPPRESLLELCRSILHGWEEGLGRIHETGLTLGLGAAELGRVYLSEILEPTILVTEQRLLRHIARDELRDFDPRVGALALLSPLLLSLLHQRNLGGHETRPLDLDGYLETHVDGFLRGHVAASSTTR